MNIKEFYTDIKWETVKDINRALNWEIFCGPMPEEYWNDSDPLENYTWINIPKAIEDMKEILSDIPNTIWIDEDSGCISISNPENNMDNWIYDDDRLPIWVGGEWYEIDPRSEILHDNVYKLIYS